MVHISQHIMDLIEKLPQYGLGDVQYMQLIDKCRRGKKNR